jgi:GTP diphosphokinase / guanosine-3',5'-bis(diphosphate) 3'-diphosphatase
MKQEESIHTDMAAQVPVPSADNATSDNSTAQLTIPGSPEDRTLIRKEYRKLLKCFKKPLEEEDKKMIREAFELAADAHQTQKRKSGEPYILHPIAVARICVEEIGLGATAAVCALLHDVVEDTHIKLPEIKQQFGDKVALIVDGLTKLDSLHESESPQAENISKVLRAMVSDVRVVLIKMADRLHNLRTIKSMPEHKQMKIAAETNTIYTPLAHRLGLNEIKTEFQDSCLKIMQPDMYRLVAKKLAETKRDREKYIQSFCAPVEEWIAENNINARVIGRPKSIYSIHNKIKNKGIEFEDIYDLFAIRIIIDAPEAEERSLCWQVYTFITDYFIPIAERLKDWISVPKSNGYQSLHTTVIGPEGRYVEVQIRSTRMDDIAERGFAAHWKYKGVRSISTQKRDVFEAWMSQVRDTLENSDSSNPIEFLNDFQGNFFNEEVHVSTPKGEVRILPKGATALDFAFSIHTNIGCTCQAVKVGNRLVPISHVLKNGDQVEVITNKNQKPTEDWLKFAVTTKARTRIRTSLKDEKRKQAEYGREILERKLNAFKVSVDDNADMLAKWYGFVDRLEFLNAIALEQVDFSELKKFRADGSKLVEIGEKVGRPAPNPEEPSIPTPNKQKTEQKSEVIINGEPGSYYKHSLATCCSPMPGDPIFAYTSTTGMRIHRYTCPNAEHLLSAYAHRVMKAGWGNTAKTNFVAEIKITGVDHGPGVIQQLTDKLAKLGMNIRSLSISGEDNYFEGRIGLVVINVDQLNLAMRALKEIELVSTIERLE